LFIFDFKFDHHFSCRRHLQVAGLAFGELDRRATKAASDFPVIGLVMHLYLTGIGEHGINADDQRSPRRDTHLLAFRQVFAETVE